MNCLFLLLKGEERLETGTESIHKDGSMHENMIMVTDQYDDNNTYEDTNGTNACEQMKMTTCNAQYDDLCLSYSVCEERGRRFRLPMAVDTQTGEVFTNGLPAADSTDESDPRFFVLVRDATFHSIIGNPATFSAGSNDVGNSKLHHVLACNCR